MVIIPNSASHTIFTNASNVHGYAQLTNVQFPSTAAGSFDVIANQGLPDEQSINIPIISFFGSFTIDNLKFTFPNKFQSIVLVNNTGNNITFDFQSQEIFNTTINNTIFQSPIIC